jgi:hypothetical protein
VRVIPLFMAALMLTFSTMSCGGERAPVTQPSSPGVTVNGTERLAWDQQARDNPPDLDFNVYVDDAPQLATFVRCELIVSESIFSCSAAMPQMTPGPHVLSISAVGGVESPRSEPLRVVFAPGGAISHSESSAQRSSPDSSTVRLVASGIVDPVDIAVIPDRGVLVAERGGRILLYDARDHSFTPVLVERPQVQSAELLSMAVGLNGSSTEVYIATAAASRGAVARYLLAGRSLVNRVVVMDDVPVAGDAPAMKLVMGPDGKLYVAFDDAGDPGGVSDMGSLAGKVWRLNRDGTTPQEGSGSRPFYALGSGHPMGMEWLGGGETFVVLGEGEGGVAHLRFTSIVDGAVSEQSQQTFPASLRPGAIVSLNDRRGNTERDHLLVTMRNAAGLLRMRFDNGAITEFEWLRQEVGVVQAVAAAGEGQLYVCADGNLFLLAHALPDFF